MDSTPMDNSEEKIEEKTSIEEVSTTSEPVHKKESGSKKPPKPFPNYTIEESVQVAFALKQYNAGNPWSPDDIAKALSTSRKTTNFFYLTSASRAYGFTAGTSNAKIIELTPLGRRYVYATSKNEEYSCIYEAFRNIKILNDVYEYFKGAGLPEKKYLSNTLESTFNLEVQYHDEFIKLYSDNLFFLNKFTSGIEGNSKSTSGSKGGATKTPPTKDGKGKRELFVIMPFAEKTDAYPKGFFEEMFSSLIVPAASDADIFAQTANKSGSDIIQATIVNQIINADLILADLTEHNPNVLFELGIAIACQKKVVLIRAKGTKPIFDVDNLLRVFDYDPNLWKSTLERDVPNLTDHILATDVNEGKSYLELLKKS